MINRAIGYTVGIGVLGLIGAVALKALSTHMNIRIPDILGLTPGVDLHLTTITLMVVTILAVIATLVAGFRHNKSYGGVVKYFQWFGGFAVTIGTFIGILLLLYGPGGAYDRFQNVHAGLGKFFDELTNGWTNFSDWRLLASIAVIGVVILLLQKGSRTALQSAMRSAVDPLLRLTVVGVLVFGALYFEEEIRGVIKEWQNPTTPSTRVAKEPPTEIPAPWTSTELRELQETYNRGTLELTQGRTAAIYASKDDCVVYPPAARSLIRSSSKSLYGNNYEVRVWLLDHAPRELKVPYTFKPFKEDDSCSSWE